MTPGPRNLITDVAGLSVGNAEDHRIKTGVTVLTADRPFVAAVDIMGGSPGTRETDLLDPSRWVTEIDALVLSGGSAYGLDAPSGVSDALRALGRGFRAGTAIIPVVPGAILFDLINGGDDWTDNPYRALGRAAFAAAGGDFALGSAGAGTGALTITLKGGLGSASLVLESGHTVGALVACNARGNVTMGDTAHFWSAPFEVGNEFGGLGPYPGRLPLADLSREERIVRRSPMESTTIAIVATDAGLNKGQLKRVAVQAQDGMARAMSPSHSIFDGDLIFAAATGEKPMKDELYDLVHIGHAAAICLSRAIARAIYEATPAPDDVQPTWRQRFGT